VRVRSRLGRLFDGLFEWLMRPSVRRVRRWSFLVTLPVTYLVFRLRGAETGLALVGLELVVGVTVMVVLYRMGGARREVVLDLIAHPLVRRLTATEMHVLLTAPRALARRLRGHRREERFGYARRSSELPFALALLPAIAAEAVAVHLLLPEGWLWMKVGILAVSAYGYLWVFSLALGMRTEPHVLRSSELEVRFGPLYRARIPVELIERAEPRAGKAAGRPGLTFDGDAARLTAEGAAEVRLTLRAPVQLRRPLAEPVSITELSIPAERPADLVRALERARAGQDGGDPTGEEEEEDDHNQKPLRRWDGSALAAAPDRG